MKQFIEKLRKYVLLWVPLILFLYSGSTKADSVVVAYSTPSCQYFVVADQYGSYDIYQIFGSLLPNKGDTLTALAGSSSTLFGVQQFTGVYGQQQYYVQNIFLGFSSLQAQYKQLCNITLTNGTPAATPPSAARADCIMNWAAANLPAFFQFTGPSTYAPGAAIFYYRPWNPAKYNELFFNLANGEVVVNGPMTGNTSLLIGTQDTLKPYTGC